MEICRRHFGGLLLAGMGAAGFSSVNRTKLLILVVLEQFRPSYLEAVRPQLAPGGFRKLLEKSAFFNNCWQQASTFTASSLGSLATGTWPAQHGIVADRWYDRTVNTPVAASDEALLAPTLLSAISSETPSRLVVLAPTREQAALFAGSPDAHLFWVDAEARIASNRDLPGWLEGFTLPNLPDQVHNAKWQALGAPADAPPLRVMTWSEDHAREFMALYRASPFAQSALFDLASEMVTRDGLGQSDTLDVLCIVSGAMEQLGYETGAQSPLMEQMTLQLDRRLETLLNLLAKTPGEGAFSLALASAHGAPEEPYAAARSRMAVSGEDLAQAIQTSLAAQGLPGVAKYVYPFLYLRSVANRDPELTRIAAGRAALDNPAVAGFYTAGGFCSIRDGWQRRFANSFHAVRSGDVMISYRPGYIENSGQNRGISYGSLYNYDARVPMAFYGPHFRPGVYEQSVNAVDFATTLARVAGVSPPAASVGRVLTEALAE